MRELSEQKISRILIWRAGLLGDTLVSIPALKAIRAYFRSSEISLVWQKTISNEHVNPMQILEGTGLVDRFEVDELSNSPITRLKNAVRLWNKIAKYKPDLAIILEAPYWRSSKREFFLRLCRVPNIIAPNHSSLNDTRERIIRDRNGKLSRITHISDQLLSVLEQGGIPVPLKGQGDPSLSLPIGIKESVTELFLNHSLNDKVVIGVGLWSNMPSKRWPVENYIKVLENLRESHGVLPVFLGGEHDRKICETVREKLGVGVNLAGKLTIQQGIEVLTRTRFYLGNDTGIMHMAVSAGIPCIAIFSATNAPGLWEPYGKHHIVLRKEIDCEGCLLQVCNVRLNECLRMITVDEVLQAAERLIYEKGIKSLVEAK